MKNSTTSAYGTGAKAHDVPTVNMRPLRDAAAWQVQPLREKRQTVSEPRGVMRAEDGIVRARLGGEASTRSASVVRADSASDVRRTATYQPWRGRGLTR